MKASTEAIEERELGGVAERPSRRVQLQAEAESQDRGDRFESAERHDRRRAALDPTDFGPRTADGPRDRVLADIGVETRVAKLAADLAQMVLGVAPAAVSPALDRWHEVTMPPGHHPAITRAALRG